MRNIWMWGLLVLVAAVVMSIRAGYAGTTYQDPFAYCAAVGTADEPGHPYVGPKMPEAVARGLQKAFGISDPNVREPFRKNSFWRCMGGKVYACTIGANLPCQEKADISRAAAPAVAEYCKANPDAAVVPAYVTGRATVYLWRCKGGQPMIVRQVTKPDARGYLSNIWYEIART